MTKQTPIYGHKHVLNIGYIWQKQRFQHLTLSQMDEHKQVQVRKQGNIMPKPHPEIVQIDTMEILYLQLKTHLSAFITECYALY